MTKTTLWTNPTPTASTFPAQTVTLSDSIRNYDYIGIRYIQSQGYPTESNGLVKVSEFLNMTNLTSYSPQFGFGNINAAGSELYFRRLNYASDTSIYISIAGAVNKSGTSNVISFPLEIYGLK